MTDGDGAPINVSLLLFFTLLSLFPLYQCLMSLKGRNCLPLIGLQPVVRSIKGWWLACYVDR